MQQDIRYIGVNDHTIDLFEGQYRVPNGISYNSYVIDDEHIAVMDTVDAAFKKQWLEQLCAVLGERSPSYLIVSHMEPDHSANIHAFAQTYPQAKIVATEKAFAMMKHYFKSDYAERRVMVKDGDMLSLGRHQLSFFTAPMVHWPEVMVTFDAASRTLFSADAFGKFGALDADEPWEDEARRYYIGIVGKYGGQVQSLFKKLQGVPLERICPLHGPTLEGDLTKYMQCYQTWSSYGVESDGVAVFYTSVYGHTKEAVDRLVSMLRNRGCPTVEVYDLARCDRSEALAAAFRYGKSVLATTTYNGDVFPFMRDFLHDLTEHSFKNRTVGIIENGSWMPMAAKTVRKMLESSQNVVFTDTTVSIRAAMDDQSIAAMDAMVNELLA